MSILPGAHDFVVNNDFRTYHQYGKSGIDILSEASAHGATMDSRDHYDRRCFPKTREQYIADIASWAIGSDDRPPLIYWMRGPAGVGKSAIAQSCAEHLKNEGHLGAAFFFTVKKHNNPLCLFTTIAYQLAVLLPDYRAIVNDRVSKDKTLADKKISSQFKLLIAEPLQELDKQGKGVQAKAIFVDGLDECEGEDAQAEIVEIIASSIRTRSTPFRWAIFSRAEPHIVSIFARDDTAAATHSVELPISHEADSDIELYLRGEFRNILQRRNCPQLLLSWPVDGDIKKLVDAASGLFAHPAAVLRFVGHPSDWQFRERLQAVLDAVLRPNTQHSVSHRAFAELDALYFLIMSRVPEDVLLDAQLLCCRLVLSGVYVRDYKAWCAIFCNALGVSESVFRGICHPLHAVIAYQQFPDSLNSLDSRIDLTRSYHDQNQYLQLPSAVDDQLFHFYGCLTFHHKSFYDFLVKPERSSIYCVTTPAMREKLFDRYIQQHHHYASSYIIQDSKLVLAPGLSGSSTSLSWPQGSEFIDSFFKLRAFYNISHFLSHRSPGFRLLLGNIPFSSLQSLALLDYRKSLVAGTMAFGLGLRIVDGSAMVRQIDSSHFLCVREDNYDNVFSPAAFLGMVKKLKQAGVIRPYHSRLGSSCAVSVFHSLSRLKPRGRRCCGQYRLGHGAKSVIWCWEFDTERRYFHEIQTIDFAEAVALYKAEKFKIWEESWVPPPARPPMLSSPGCGPIFIWSLLVLCAASILHIFLTGT